MCCPWAASGRGTVIVAARSTQSLDLMNHPVAHWWTKRQLDLVEDRSRTWRREKFESSPAVEHRVDGVRVLGKVEAGAPGPTVIAEGWDHEHCELCWAKISQLPGSSPEGYTDGNHWICLDCFNQYVQPRLSA